MNCNLIKDDILGWGKVLICTPMLAPIQSAGNIKVGNYFYRIYIGEEEIPLVPTMIDVGAQLKEDKEVSLVGEDSGSEWTEDLDHEYISETDWGVMRAVSREEMKRRVMKLK